MSSPVWKWPCAGFCRVDSSWVRDLVYILCSLICVQFSFGRSSSTVVLVWSFIVVIGERQLLMCFGIIWKSRVICHLQALEDEFTRKLQEQEVFFKMTGDSECLNPSAQSRISKFYPIPSVHPSGFWKKHLHTELCTDTQCESWVSAALSPFFLFLNCDFAQWWLFKKTSLHFRPTWVKDLFVQPSVIVFL